MNTYALNVQLRAAAEAATKAAEAAELNRAQLDRIESLLGDLATTIKELMPALKTAASKARS